MKNQDEALDREQARQALEQVLKLCGGMHPAVRKPLADEAKRLWHRLGITDPVPAIEERRPRALYERERIRRRRLRELFTKTTPNVRTPRPPKRGSQAPTPAGAKSAQPEPKLNGKQVYNGVKFPSRSAARVRTISGLTLKDYLGNR